MISYEPVGIRLNIQSELLIQINQVNRSNQKLRSECNPYDSSRKGNIRYFLRIRKSFAYGLECFRKIHAPYLRYIYKF